MLRHKHDVGRHELIHAHASQRSMLEKRYPDLGWKRFDIDSSTIASSYIHDTSKKISEVFNAAIKAAPSILVIDEKSGCSGVGGVAERR